MASQGIYSVQNCSFTQIPRCRFSVDRSNTRVSLNNHSLFNRIVQKRSLLRISAIHSNSSSKLEPFDGIVSRKNEMAHDNELSFSEKFDEWIKDSVTEIVKNLKQAPLLMQVHDSDDGTAKFKTGKIVAQQWSNLASEWKIGENLSPEGIIFVEELKNHNSENEVDDDSLGKEGKTKAWGVVIQGKGLNSAPACYLLKTSRVRTGLDLFCTHFCLVKVKNFRESAVSQLERCWLSQ